MIKNKVEAIEYIKEQLEILTNKKQSYKELQKEIVGIEDEIESFRFNFNLSDEEMNEAYGGEYDKEKEDYRY